MEIRVKDLLARLVSGDTEALEPLARLPKGELEKWGESIELVVRAEAVAKVLRELSMNSIDGEVAQRWASFVRRGFFEGLDGDSVIKPVSINYEDSYEAAITEAVSRLDEIGDLVDGEVPDQAEIGLLLLALGYLS